MIKYAAQQSKSAKQDSATAQRIQAHLYLCDGEYVMIPSNVWAEVVLHNGAWGKLWILCTRILLDLIVVLYPRLWWFNFENYMNML